MAYDNTSLTGDEICDYYYDIENNFMNPPSPTGFFIYKVIGSAFDRLNDLVAQFRNDYSILDCNVGNVEIVKSFPEEPDTNHTYYVHQYNTPTDACFTKYSYVDGEWVSETVTGDVLNSLDVFWGRSYNLPRPLLYEGQKADYSLIDNGTTSSHTDCWTVTNGTMTRESTYTRLVESAQTLMCLMNSAYITPTSTVEFDFKAIDGVKTYAFVYIRNGAGGISLANLTLNSIGGDIGEWIHLKIVFNNTDTITIYSSKLDNPITKTLSSTSSNYRLLLYCGGANTELHFKNVKVYTGEDKERPLNDDEYRIYLYLKNHQLLTMKDLLVAFGNAFGSAETSTTVLNSIHTVDHKTYDNPPFSNDSLRAYDDEDMDITTDKLVDKDGVNLINNRLAQGITSILIPDEGWDEEYLRFLESFISIKGNILISTGG